MDRMDIPAELMIVGSISLSVLCATAVALANLAH